MGVSINLAKLDSLSEPQAGLVVAGWTNMSISLKGNGRRMAIGPSDSPAIPPFHIIFSNHGGLLNSSIAKL